MDFFLLHISTNPRPLCPRKPLCLISPNHYPPFTDQYLLGPAGPSRHAGKCLPTGHHVCFGLIAACWPYFFFEVSLIKLFFWAVDVPDLTGVGGLSQQNYPFKSLNQDLEQTQGLLTITLITISWRNIKFLLQSGSDSSNGCDNVAEIYLVRGF